VKSYTLPETQHTSAYVSIRQHTSAYVLLTSTAFTPDDTHALLQAACISIRQHASAYVLLTSTTTLMLLRWDARRGRT
jgi:vesicle coat complex subunit